jgi:hypothetical protein
LGPFSKQNKSGRGFIIEMERSSRTHYHLYTRDALTKEKFKLRNKIDRAANIPFAILGFIWLNLLVFYMIMGNEVFLKGASVIWILFQAELLIKIYLSPSAKVYFKSNPATTASAIIPLLRILSLFNFVAARKQLKNYQQKVFNS